MQPFQIRHLSSRGQRLQLIIKRIDGSNKIDIDLDLLKLISLTSEKFSVSLNLILLKKKYMKKFTTLLAMKLTSS
jgi:hypothetical protein